MFNTSVQPPLLSLSFLPHILFPPRLLWIFSSLELLRWSASEVETSVHFALQTYSDWAPNRRETVRDVESDMPGLQFGEVNILCWSKVSRAVVKCPWIPSSKPKGKFPWESKQEQCPCLSQASFSYYFPRLGNIFLRNSQLNPFSPQTLCRVHFSNSLGQHLSVFSRWKQPEFLKSFSSVLLWTCS